MLQLLCIDVHPESLAFKLTQEKKNIKSPESDSRSSLEHLI